MTEPRSCGSGCDCGCCEGTEPLTPRSVANRPGLEALRYRVGTHASFLETMKARLSTKSLLGLTTREEGDAAIALLDAWAVVADVLTFYQERIANEGYLRTATERRSVLELARLVGYEPRPGVAASTHLAYILDEGPETLIPAGAAVRSVPGPGELPQTFETSEDLVARADWNNLQIRLTRPQQPDLFAIKESPDDPSPVVLYLKGITTQLKSNDPLLIDTGDLLPRLYRTMKVEPDAAKDRTRVEVDPWVKEPGTPTTTTTTTTATTTATKRASLLSVVARFSDLEAQGISSGVTTRRVLTQLKALKTALAEGGGESELRSAVEEVLTKLREEERAANRIGASRVRPWLAGLTAELEASLGASNPAPATTTLSNILAALAAPPNPQPANSLRLNRNLEQLFGPTSELAAKLLTVARPELRDVLYQAWRNVPVTRAPTLKVCALRTRAAVFGHHAPLELVQKFSGQKASFKAQEWTPQGEEEKFVWLDTAYPQILPGSWIVLLRPGSNDRIPELLITRVVGTREMSRARYGLSAKVTGVQLLDRWLNLPKDVEKRDDFDVIRGTAVFGACEELTLAEEPIAAPLCGQAIELASLYDGLQPGHFLIVAGERTDVRDLVAIAPSPEERVKVTGVSGAELVMLAGVDQRLAEASARETAEPAPLAGERFHTTLRLATELAYCYRRDTVVIYGNVAHATHGETRFEVLGSGDAAKPHQSFTLKQPPLTYISAPTASGLESTLQARVNDVLWHQADCPAGLGPADRSYFVRTGDGATTTIIFGDGNRGARLPSGSENVRARYRNGIGKQGNVKAGQISQLATRPLGVKDVINPIPATGGADAESRDQARRNAPLAVMALDRLVSTQDYADFARTFAGVGKSSAVRLTDGRVELVHVTIAGEDDIPIREESELFVNLKAALRRFGEPRQPLLLALRKSCFLVVQAEVRVLPDYRWDKVEPKIRAAMVEAFGFARRDLGQDTLLSEVYRTVQGVRGVDAVDVNLFTTRDPENLTAEIDFGSQPKPRLWAHLAQMVEGTIHPAQLIYLTAAVADTLILKERKS